MRIATAFLNIQNQPLAGQFRRLFLFQLSIKGKIMTTFNKILNPMYSTIASYSTQDDGSLNAKYVVGTGEESDSEVTNFVIITSEYKYIDAQSAKAITDAPLTKEDIGKTPTQIMLGRIYNHLKETGQIVV
ncbi:hypothetical protein 3927AP1_28 [Mannheimia phage vB_MhS_3927AP1]|nr:hypothetical protein 3927AP1_28 [Mannheimia phage vB_MhS_3927AP1]